MDVGILSVENVAGIVNCTQNKDLVNALKKKRGNGKMNIEEKEITRVCAICGKEYKDVQIIINKCSTQKYAICNDCREKVTCSHEITLQTK